MKDKGFSGLKIWLEGSVYPFALLLAGLLCLAVPVTGLFFPPEEMFPYLAKRLVYGIYCFFVLMFFFCMLFRVMRKIYSAVCLFYMSEKNGIPPENCYTLSFTLRYIGCRLLSAYYKLIWTTVFFLPFGVSLFFLAYHLYEPEGMLRGIFFARLILTVLLFFTALIFSFTVNGRYFLLDYLQYLNPLEPPDSIIRSSVLLTRGRLISLALKRFLLLIISPLGIIAPLNGFIRLRRAQLQISVYRESKL